MRIGSSRQKYSPWLVVHFNKTETILEDDAVAPWLPPEEASESCDPYYDFCELLLHFDEILTTTGGGIVFNRIMKDYSPYNVSVSITGNVIASTSEYVFGAAAYFDGTGDAILAINPPTASTWMKFGARDFTIEWRQRIASFNDVQTIMSKWGVTSNRNILIYSFQGYISFWWTTNGSTNQSTALSFTSPVVENTWYSMALVRKNGSLSLYRDGFLQDSKSFSYSIYYAPNQLAIGSLYNANSRSLAGYLDELRITIGVARYTENYTPATAPFPNNGCV